LLVHAVADVKVDRPAHVPQELWVDFDVYDPPGGRDDLHAAWQRLAGGPDFVWAPYHGGYWIPTRARDIDFIQRTHDPFSMRDVTIPANTRPTRGLPLEADPPEHAGFRVVLNPWFTPKRVGPLKEFTQQLAIELIDGFRSRGSCEFMTEFATLLPIAIFMRMTNLPMTDRLELLRYAQMSTRGAPSERGKSFELMMAYLMPVIADRRANPKDDVLSAVVRSQVDGKPIRDQDMMSMLLILLFGGLDTVASTMGFIANFLANSPAHRRQLIERPERVDHAIEELMRRFAPSATARTMTRDYEYHGVQFKAGDKVYVSPILAGMDESRYPNALTIDFDRTDVIHQSFGNGPHRCPGSMLARLEIKVFLLEWLAHIPDFRVKPGEKVIFGTGQVNCVERLVLSWT
jgi:cytochrome P450